MENDAQMRSFIRIHSQRAWISLKLPDLIPIISINSIGMLFLILCSARCEREGRKKVKRERETDERGKRDEKEAELQFIKIERKLIKIWFKLV